MWRSCRGPETNHNDGTRTISDISGPVVHPRDSDVLLVILLVSDVEHIPEMKQALDKVVILADIPVPETESEPDTWVHVDGMSTYHPNYFQMARSPAQIFHHTYSG